jgi:peptidoglycan/xylan/chitin deacetylase (PgdA/CDA1 family)
MIRDKVGYGTRQLFNPPESLYEPFPVAKESEKLDFINFIHGSRFRRREVSLVFNAIDTVEGLTDILNTLSEYGIRTTFFINGEFIRRHPGAVQEIAEAGHEIGSLFYIHFNMTDARYQMDKEFVKRGLARNEDDYFQVTEKELSLLWHAPFYFVNSKIIEAAHEMNYIHVGRDIDSLDWVTTEQAAKSSGVYMPSVELVQRIINLKKPGSIISIRIGQTEGTREDYLFHNLDVLINGLISRGYSIVPVSLLIDHAK